MSRPPRFPPGINSGIDGTSGERSRSSIIIGAALIFGLEAAMGLLLFGVFSETMGLASKVYLAELPLIGGLFGVLDDEMTVSHLLAILLAVFSIAVPIMIWSVALEERVFDDPQAWIAQPANRIRAGLALGVYASVVALEVINLYTLIAKESVQGPFASAAAANPLMNFLAANQGLGIFVAFLIALVNTVLALLTVRAARSLHAGLKG